MSDFENSRRGTLFSYSTDVPRPTRRGTPSATTPPSAAKAGPDPSDVTPIDGVHCDDGVRLPQWAPAPQRLSLPPAPQHGVFFAQERACTRMPVGRRGRALPLDRKDRWSLWRRLCRRHGARPIPLSYYPYTPISQSTSLAQPRSWRINRSGTNNIVLSSH